MPRSEREGDADDDEPPAGADEPAEEYLDELRHRFASAGCVRGRNLGERGRGGAHPDEYRAGDGSGHTDDAQARGPGRARGTQ